MKHTIKNPLVLRYTESDKISTNPRPIIKTQELVSKEIAQEIAEALRNLTDVCEDVKFTVKKKIHPKSKFTICMQEAKQALKNANS